MIQPILNPVELPADLFPAEMKFARCLARGIPCTVGNGKLPKEAVKSGDNANVVRGEVIRFFAYGGDPDEYPVGGAVIGLQGAWISGLLHLMHAHIPYALRLVRCKFPASVVMQHAECAALYLDGSHLAQGLNADALTVKGGVRFDGFVAKDSVRLPGANIGGQFSCTGGKFHNPEGRALHAEGVTVNDALIWRKVRGEGCVHLGNAKIGILADDADSWKPFEVVLDGFTYDQIVGPTDAKSRIEWLAKRPGWKPFSPLPYEQAAKVLRSMGKDIDAWDIEREKKRLQRKADGASWLRKCGGWIVDTLQDAVYRPLRTVRWALSVMAIGAVAFALADYYSHIVPTHPVVTLSEDYRGSVAPHGDLRPTQAVPPEYPAFHPLAFSVDVFTPSAVFRQEDSWGTRSGSGDWWSLGDFGVLWLLTLWYCFQIAAGWILIPLFLLSITGILRRRESPDEED